MGKSEKSFSDLFSLLLLLLISKCYVRTRNNRRRCLRSEKFTCRYILTLETSELYWKVKSIEKEQKQRKTQRRLTRQERNSSSVQQQQNTTNNKWGIREIHTEYNNNNNWLHRIILKEICLHFRYLLLFPPSSWFVAGFLYCFISAFSSTNHPRIVLNVCVLNFPAKPNSK